MAIARVQTMQGGSSATATTVVSGASGSSVTAGNALVVMIRIAGSELQEITGVTDSVGNTYVQGAQVVANPGMSVWYCLDCIGGSGVVVTGTLSATATYRWIYVIEYSGVNSLDLAGVKNPGTATTDLTSDVFSTADAVEVVVMGASQGSITSYTAGADFTLIDGTIPDVGTYGGVEERITSSALTSYTAHITSAASNTYTVVWIALSESEPAPPVLAFDAGIESVRTDTSDPMTWTHTPVGTPKGIVVAFVHGVSDTDHVVSVTYGGVAMAEVIRRTDTVTELGAAELWFLGSSIPTGAQTISADLASGTTDDIHGISWSLTSSGGNTEVIDFDGLAENAANPTVTMNKGGRLGWSVAAMYGGGAAPGGTLSAGNTLSHTHDLGNFYSQSCYETTIDTADHTIGWSTLTSDDLAFVALCVAEITAVTYVPRHPAHDHANPAVF